MALSDSLPRAPSMDPGRSEGEGVGVLITKLRPQPTRESQMLSCWKQMRTQL